MTHHLSHTTLTHTIFDTTSLTHTISHTPSKTIFHTPPFTHHLSHTIFHTQLCHTPSFTTRSLSHTIFHHTIFHADSFVTHHLPHLSFVFPSFPVPATTLFAHYWKKLTCGLSGPFIFNLQHFVGRIPSLCPTSISRARTGRCLLCCRLPNQQGNVRRIMAATQQRTTYTYTPSASLAALFFIGCVFSTCFQTLPG